MMAQVTPIASSSCMIPEHVCAHLSQCDHVAVCLQQRQDVCLLLTL